MATKTGGFVAGDALTDTQINTYLQQRDAWDTWTPTWTNVTVGNGTVVAKYNQIGRIVHWQVSFSFGTTSAVSGLMGFTLPVTAARSGQMPVAGHFFDSSASTFYPVAPYQSSTTQMDVYAVLASGTYASHTATSSTLPFTWTTSDVLSIGGTYEAASAP